MLDGGAFVDAGCGDAGPPPEVAVGAAATGSCAGDGLTPFVENPPHLNHFIVIGRRLIRICDRESLLAIFLAQSGH